MERAINMGDNEGVSTISELSFKDKYSLFLFISASIFLSFIIVIISMVMYDGSGAAQLDLSRPGYKDVRSQAKKNEGDFQNYSSSGQINKEAISEFKSIYNIQAQKVKSVDAFGGDPLNPDALGIGAQPEL